ncbi:hypothetical protein [Paenibacillus sp. MBLB4367]|uniref:hypothetical protein n=1 Tax=Paenibacillus sp. MBLB4367 TaxID=3384767 RepID=UPI003908072D
MHAISTKHVMISALALTLLLSTCLGAPPKRASAEGKSSIRSDAGIAMQRMFKMRENAQQRARSTRLPIVSETAALLELDTDQLKQKLAQNMTIADIAAEQGFSVKDLASKLLKLRTGNIDQAVDNGRLNAETADAIKTRMVRHIDFMLRQKGGSLLERQHAEPAAATADHPLRAFDPDKMAALIGTTPEALSSDLQAGRTLTDIAETYGLSKPQLLNKIKAELEGSPSV